MKLTKEQAKELKQQFVHGAYTTDAIIHVINSMTEQDPIEITEQSILEFNGNKYKVETLEHGFGGSLSFPDTITLRKV